MAATVNQASPGDRSRQALLVWGVFFVVIVIINGTIPFLLGADLLHAWTSSTLKSFLLAFVVYAVLFSAVPLVLIKGWETVRMPPFLRSRDGDPISNTKLYVMNNVIGRSRHSKQ
jgi:hypothetical protein